MKGTTVIATAIATLGLAACGSTVAPRVTPTHATALPATPAPTATPMPTPSPTPVPAVAGPLVVASRGECSNSVGTDNGTLVEVTLARVCMGPTRLSP